MSRAEEQDYLGEFGLDDDNGATGKNKNLRDDGLGAFSSLKVEALQEAWINEVNSPEILPYKEDIILEIKTNLQDQTDLIESLLENMEEQGQQGLYFTAMLYQMDIERVRYSLARYHRVRILKIEKSADYIFSETSVKDRLSEAEKDFMGALSSLNDEFFNDVLKTKLDNEARRFYTTDDLVTHSTPNLSKYVYFRAKDSVVLTGNDGGQATAYPAGVAGMAEYAGQIQQFIQEGRVMLL